MGPLGYSVGTTTVAGRLREVPQSQGAGADESGLPVCLGARYFARVSFL